MVDDKVALKTIDKKDLVAILKKKKFLFGKEKVDQKSFKLVDLAGKITMEKVLQLKGFDCTFTFSLREPIRSKQFDQVPIKKLVVDSFPEPFRGGAQ
jgi:hypothetical protein